MDISNISDWIRAPFIILAAVFRWLTKNLISIIIIVGTLILIYCIFKCSKWIGAEPEKKPGEDETSSEKDQGP